MILIKHWGTHEELLGEEINIKDVFSPPSAPLLTAYEADITATFCGEYYVYNLPTVPLCAARYCAQHLE